MPRGIPAEFTPLEQQVIHEAVRQGWTLRNIAAFIGKSTTVVHRYLRRPRPYPENPEDCEIVMPIQLTPSSPPTPIHPGDAAYCVVSHKTGIDDHPKLQRPSKRKKAGKPAPKFVPRGAKPRVDP